MRVLNPVGDKEEVKHERQLAPRLDMLSGKVIGIVDDGAGKAYFKRIEELLNERVKPTQIIRKVKPHFSQPSPIEMIEEIAKSSDAVIVGLGI